MVKCLCDWRDKLVIFLGLTYTKECQMYECKFPTVNNTNVSFFVYFFFLICVQVKSTWMLCILCNFFDEVFNSFFCTYCLSPYRPLKE